MSGPSIPTSPAASNASQLAPLVRVEGLTKHFPVASGLFARSSRVLHAVEDVTLDVPRGATLGVVGESGCGKSTLGRLMLALVAPTRGRVLFDGLDLATLRPKELRALRRRMQLVFQDPYGALNPRIRVGAAIEEALEIHHTELDRAARRARVEALLERVGLRAEHAARWPAEFSGGQRQRIVIARALAVEPELLVADEPVSALDVSIQAQILNLLSDLQAERHLTMVFISHDLKVVEHVASEVAVMYLGRIVERAPTRALFAAPRHPYTHALLSAIPDPRPGQKKARVILDGDVPSPITPPPGCAFHTRCPLRPKLTSAEQARCTTDVPQLRVITDGHTSACHFAERLGT
ncbi:dipeptide ABC transporter ATP-binding protein [Myxococcota bacterium]|nr:dipeptide ABC transporter ATP-binding protein [Myxococcota bacterium]